jgi:hypothetical protein
MQDETMLVLADRLKALRGVKDDLAEQTKANNAEIERTERELSDLMAQEEIQSFKRAGTLFYLTSHTYASPIAGRKADLYDALRAQGHGDIIVETVNTQTLSSFVRERIAENADELPPWLEGVVNTHEKVTVGLRKSGK